ncbi:carbohydrate sulfotransferase 13 [Suricata suricatta]|uniref:carbohydrate sulfotransferase 13 n=1 Tax=Suricata suricatta TaxID=37032 RepID=UPI001155B6EA|nr:carbohydrate sulfotransferase 13 [Suricata suricatta]
MGRRCWRRRALAAACLGAALLLLGAAPRALRPAFENTLGSGWLSGKRRSPLQMLYDLDQDALARGHDVRFAEFLAYLLDPRTRREEPFNEHWERAHALCHPCRLRYDVVGKFETLAEDAAFVLDLVGAPGLRFPAPPPRAKAADARDLAERLFRDISPFYQRRLFDLYRMDFLLFNYSAPAYLRLH